MNIYRLTACSSGSLSKWEDIHQTVIQFQRSSVGQLIFQFNSLPYATISARSAYCPHTAIRLQKQWIWPNMMSSCIYRDGQKSFYRSMSTYIRWYTCVVYDCKLEFPLNLVGSGSVPKWVKTVAGCLWLLTSSRPCRFPNSAQALRPMRNCHLFAMRYTAGDFAKLPEPSCLAMAACSRGQLRHTRPASWYETDILVNRTKAFWHSVPALLKAALASMTHGEMMLNGRDQAEIIRSECGS